MSTMAMSIVVQIRADTEETEGEKAYVNIAGYKHNKIVYSGNIRKTFRYRVDKNDGRMEVAEEAEYVERYAIFVNLSKNDTTEHCQHKQTCIQYKQKRILCHTEVVGRTEQADKFSLLLLLWLCKPVLNVSSELSF